MDSSFLSSRVTICWSRSWVPKEDVLLLLLLSSCCRWIVVGGGDVFALVSVSSDGIFCWLAVDVGGSSMSVFVVSFGKDDV